MGVAGASEIYGSEKEIKRARARARKRMAKRERDASLSSHTRARVGCTRKERRVLSHGHACARYVMERVKRAQSRSRSHPRDPRQAAPASAAVAVAVAAASASSTTFPRRQRVRLVSGYGPHTGRRSSIVALGDDYFRRDRNISDEGAQFSLSLRRLTFHSSSRLATRT